MQETNFNTHQLKAFYDMDYNSLLFFELVVALVMHATYKSLKSSHDQGKPKKYSELAMPLAYAICSAIIGTQSVIQAKCLSELMMTSREDNQMVRMTVSCIVACFEKKRRVRAVPLRKDGFIRAGTFIFCPITLLFSHPRLAGHANCC